MIYSRRRIKSRELITASRAIRAAQLRRLFARRIIDEQFTILRATIFSLSAHVTHFYLRSWWSFHFVISLLWEYIYFLLFTLDISHQLVRRVRAIYWVNIYLSNCNIESNYTAIFIRRMVNISFATLFILFLDHFEAVSFYEMCWTKYKNDFHLFEVSYRFTLRRSHTRIDRKSVV